MANSEIVLPFLKWAGGKRWLAPTLAKAIDFKFNRYIEPFVGSGSVFFTLKPERAIINDKNQDLIDCYIAIKQRPELVWRYLVDLSKVHSDEFYYLERARCHRSPFRKAAQFLYLNRTCWNGLYRVNLAGKFNVPRGTKNKVISESDNFTATARALGTAEILNLDFETVMKRAGAGDIVYADPPYTVKHNMNGFVKYNQSIFSWNDQDRLAQQAALAAKRGALVLISNADHESVWELHKDADEIVRLPRSSVISGKVTARGKTTEILITYGTQPVASKAHDIYFKNLELR